MAPTLVASALLVGALLLCVLATMVVENWHRLRVRVAVPAAEPERVPSPAPAQLEVGDLDEPLVDHLALDVAGLDLSTLDLSNLDLSGVELAQLELVEEAPVPSARPEVLHVVGGRERADQLIGALFAAYAAARLPEAGRVAAWVSAVGRPPGEDGREFEPGADLRGRPAAVARLLACAVDDRTWVTLNPSVDIALGVARRPPTCPTLAGLVALWASTRAALSQVPGEQIARVADAITTLEGRWRGTPVAADVLSLLVALTEAVEQDATLRLQVSLVPLGGDGGAPVHAPEPRSTSAALRTV